MVAFGANEHCNFDGTFEPTLITVEKDGHLWYYSGTSRGSAYLGKAVLLGGGDWSHTTLIAPGLVGGVPTLWARDNTTGTLYTYSLALDPTTANPALIAGPGIQGAFGPTLTTSAYPFIASPGDINSPGGGPDGYPDLFAISGDGRVSEFPGQSAGSGLSPTAAPVPLGYLSHHPTDQWKLTDTTDSVNSSHPLTLHGGAAFTTDPERGTVLGLNGATGYADTSGPVLNGYSSTGFTVSARVKLTNLSVNSTFVSQSGSLGIANGFQLYYSSGAHRWAFNRINKEDNTSGFSPAYGPTSGVYAPQTANWVRLTGVYNAGDRSLNLYVNGHLVSTASYAGTDWNATGPLQIGRRLADGTYGEYASASISDVQLYPSALSAASVATLDEDNPTLTQLS